MQTPGRIHDHVIEIARLRRLQRIEQYRRRIAARLRLDHFRARAISPDLKLFNRCRAKRIRRAEQRPSFRPSAGYSPAYQSSSSSLFRSRRPPESLPDRHLHRLDRRNIRARQHVANFFLQQPLQLGDIGNLLAISLLVQSRQQLFCRLRSKVCSDKGGFQIVQRVAIDLGAFSETTSSMRSLRFSRVRVTACFMRSKNALLFRFFFGTAK